MIYHKEVIIEKLNNFFLDVSPNLAAKIPVGQKKFDSYLATTDLIMQEPILTKSELHTAFNSLKKNKSAGIDQINVNVIKSVFDIIEPSLSHIFNLSLKSGHIPDKLKIAKITPIFKSDDETNISNSRPISVLPCFSKLIERNMYNRLYKYLSESKILYKKQYGFKKNHSTNHAIIKLVKHISNGFNSDCYTIGVFIDFSKAFDTQSKKNYYSSLLNKTFGNARKTWNVVKEITGVGIVKSDNLPKRLQRDDNRGDAFVNKEIAETFNSFFINIGKELAGAIPEGKKSFKFFWKKSDSFMEESELLIDELRLAISMLKTNKSAGLDEVNPDVVKAVSDIIEKPLFKIFNLSLKNGIFPDQLKLAKIIPIYKGGDDSIKSNFRPISILSCFSKILERIMHNRLYNYLEKNNILYHKQFGFRNNHSTEHAVIDLANQILNGFDNDSYTLGIFLDLSKTFDNVNHKILVYKLHNYGVVHSNLKWLQCYLQNRKQGVPYDLTCSPFESINCGVPQGSIPLLILNYINDIYLSLKILNYIIFADDSNVFFSDPNLKNIFYIVNTELIYLNEWFKANKLSLNIEKTKYILFAKSSKSENLPLKLPELTINNIKIKRLLQSSHQ
ncbi:uncharacterized protein LOC136079922 [Hydra vulgaris]|uniref:Uncharacterized protein LOC136079922 n=1 Tax=Hydra vulgaris TaxID=6087 RepID=A0ABM4BU25_HYDVU